MRESRPSLSERLTTASRKAKPTPNRASAAICPAV